MRKTLLLLTSVFLLLACSSGKNADSSVNADLHAANIVDGDVVKGSDVILNSTLQIESTDFGGRSFFCTGSVVAPTIIITAAHCLVDADDYLRKFALPAKNIKIYERNGNTIQKIGVEAVVPHPLYVKMLQQARYEFIRLGPAFSGRDIGLIKLQRPLSARYQSVEIFQDFDDIFRESMSIAGYGYASQTSSSVSMALRSGKVSVSAADKNQEFGYKTVGAKVGSQIQKSTRGFPANSSFARVLKSMKREKMSGICHGDSGGPLYFEKNGKVQLVGVNVAFEEGKAKNTNCVTDSQFQYSILLKNENLQFVKDAYQTLTGSALPGVREILQKDDPNAFDYYFGKAETPVSNAILDLNLVAVDTNLPDSFGGKIFLIPKSQDGDICSQLPKTKFVYLETSFAFVNLDGSTTAAIRVIDNSGPGTLWPYNFETHFKITEGNIEMVVLTEDGFLRNKIPKISCPQ